MRMKAYYYEFTPTDVEEIDKILSAIAHAGKASHHTDGWSNISISMEPWNGDTLAEYIQRTADDAAKAWNCRESL